MIKSALPGTGRSQRENGLPHDVAGMERKTELDPERTFEHNGIQWPLSRCNDPTVRPRRSASATYLRTVPALRGTPVAYGGLEPQETSSSSTR